MRHSLRVPWLLTLLLLPAGCRHAVIPLHERLGFVGNVVIEQEGGQPARLAGELVFERASRNLQWVIRSETGPTLSLVRKDNDAIDTFENGVPRPATPQETRDFAVVRSVVDADPATATVAAFADSGYVLTTPGRKLRVSMNETIRQHGKR